MRSKIALGLLFATATGASAHVSLTEPKAPAGSSYVGSFRIGHGCDSSPTIALRVEIPESITSARPQPKAGWTLQIEHVPLAKPVQGDTGETVTSRVSAIIWKGGPLPADQFDDFEIMMKLPATAGTLLFPATQTCASGAVHWGDAPMAGMRMPNPAPALTVTPATAATGADMKAMHGM
jgi:periplasmic copper chaperone A